MRRSCGVGQGNIEECKACGGFGEVDRRYKKEGDEEHREKGRQRGKERKKETIIIFYFIYLFIYFFTIVLQ